MSNTEEIKKYNVWLEDINCKSFFGAKLDLSSFLLKSEKNPDRDESVFFYSFLLLLTSEGDKNSENEFKNWMRFTRNIIFNTYIQNPENFYDAIKAIYDLRDKINSIETYITGAPQIAFFGEAVNQEIRKAKLIYADKGWKEPIVQCENHIYFKGDISFILELSKIDEEYVLQHFIEYGNTCSSLFMDVVRSHPQNILQRALLTYGDYLPPVGANFLFPLPNRESLRARRDNWQRVFNDSHRLIFLKALCNELNAYTSNIESKLTEMINSYSKRDWMWYFIKNPEVISYCKQGFIRWENEHDILLLKTSRVYGMNAELRSYFYFLENIKDKISKEQFNKIIYYFNRMGKYDFPCIRFKDWVFEEEKYRLEITYSKNGNYLIQLRNQEPNIEVNTALLDKLAAMSWIIPENRLIAQHEVNNEEDVLPELNTFLNVLKTL